MEYKKKFTNKDFYKDGVLQADVVLKAYEDMLAYYGVTTSKFIKDNFYATDFDLGDFENVGYAGFFWLNNEESGYMAHEIYLLPGQMIAEHKHVPTENHPPKMESWLLKSGSCYNYSIGEDTYILPELPESQQDFITVKCGVAHGINEIIHLKEIESSHFMIGGPAGAIVCEFASFHDGSGLRFTNPDVKFVNCLA